MGEKGPDPKKVARGDKEAVLKSLGLDKNEPPIEGPNEVEPRSLPVEPPTVEKADAKNPERTLEGLKADLEAKRVEYAKYDLDTSKRWKRLKRVLGFSVEEIKDDNVEEKKKEYKTALKKYLDAKRSSMGEMSKEQAAELYKEFTVGETTQLLNTKVDEEARINKEKGAWPEKAMDKYMDMVNWWRKQSFKTKLMVSGGMLLGGAAAGLTFGAVGASVFSLAGAGYRVLSGGASGVGLKKMMDAFSARREGKKTAKETEKMLSQDDWMDQFNAKMDEAVNTIDARLAAMESKNLSRRRIATYAGIFVGSGAMAQIIHSTGLGGFVKEKLFGGGVAKPNVTEHIPESVKPSAGQSVGETLIIRTPDGKVLVTPKGIESIGDASPESVELSPKSQEILKGIAPVSEPEVKTGGGIQEWMKSPATGAEVHAPEMAKPQLEEIASAKISKGGSMWGSIENQIKANPKAYGLDPEDPDFTKDIHKMTKQMLDEFASRKGLTYQELDQIARAKVRAGDTFKIIHDPSNDDIYLDDYHGKAFGADVTHTASVENIKTGASAADHHTAKVPHTTAEELKPKVGQTSAVQELTPQQRMAQIAQADQELYARHPKEFIKNTGEIAIANNRLYLSTRGLLDRVVQEAGIGKRAAFWDQPINSWDKLIASDNYIAQDVQGMDTVKKLNLNTDKLRALYPMLKKYQIQSFDSIGDCLLRAIKENPETVSAINRFVLRK